ncbi:MAG: glycosyltransferase family 2 protein [Acidimicrobiia bacterium]
MKLRTGLLAGATVVVVATLAFELRAERGRRRALELRFGDLVRANALDLVDPDSRVPADEPEIAIVIAAYNEEAAIESVLDALPTELFEHRVTPIVVIDGGTDDTASVVERAGHLAVCHEINRGQGDALRTGFALALERKAAIVVTMDADGQHRPEELPRLIEPVLAGEADYVQGSRYLGRYDDAGGARDAGIRVFTALINRASGAGVTDCTNGFRAIRGEALSRLQLEEPRFSASEIIIESARRGLRIREVSVHIRSRSHGESKKPRRLAYPLGYLGAIVRTWRRG